MADDSPAVLDAPPAFQLLTRNDPPAFQLLPRDEDRNPAGNLPPATFPLTHSSQPYSTSSPGYHAFKKRLDASFDETPEEQAELAREENTNPLDILSTPVAKIPRLEPDPGDTKATALYKAGMNNAAGLLEFGESPLGVATGGLGAGSQLVRRLIAAGFAGDIARKIPEQARAAGTLAGETGPNENVQQKLEAEIGLGGSVVLPGLLAGHAGVPEMAGDRLGANPLLLDELTKQRQAAALANEPNTRPLLAPPLQLGPGARFGVAPEGTAAEIQQMSPKELTEFQRNAQATSRQTESGQAGPVNTVAAGLEATAEPLAKDTIRSNGADWYKRGDYWVTDKPSINMTKTQLKPGRGNPVEDAIVADLEAKQQAKEAALKQVGPTAAQTTINDVTGVNRGKPGRAGLTGLALREIQERQEDARWGSPESEYGPNHAISETQAMKIQSLGKWLAAVSTERVARTYYSLSRVQPIYPYDITVKQMLEDRLGIQRPPPPPGELGGATPELPAPPTPPQLGGPNAIPERGPAPVPVGETPGNSPAVGGRVPPPEEAAPAQGQAQGQNVPQESLTTKIGNRAAEPPLEFLGNRGDAAAAKIFGEQATDVEHVEAMQRAESAAAIEAKSKTDPAERAAALRKKQFFTEAVRWAEAKLQGKESPINPGGALKDLPQDLQDKSNAVKDKMKAEYEALKKQATAPKPDWKVVVQAGEGEVPGYVQIIDPRQTEQSKSPTVESLKAAGHDVPDFSKLPSGSYTYEEAVAKAKPGLEAAVEPAPVSPKIADDLAKDKIRNEAKAVSTRSAQEIKDELVFRLQEALQKASRAVPGEKPGIVQIDIPDDGSYHIVNTVEAINQVLDKARKIDVSSEAKKNFRGEKPTAMKKAEREAAKAAEQRGRSSSAMGITPQPPEWMRKFAEEEVAPAVRAGVNVYKATRDLIVNAFSPETNAKVPNVDILFEAKGQKEKFMTRAAAAIEGARRNVGAMSQPDQIAFVDRIKTGKKQPTPELQQLADLLRQWDDRLHKEASVYKPDLAYLDNHYRVLWKVIPGTADKTGIELENVLSKRPWRGSRGFTLQHTLEDMSEGIAKGGVPVSYNPVENFLLHAQDVMKFVSANRAWEGLKKAGQAVLVERGQEPPPGFSQIKDSISKQYFKTKDTKPGEWYVETGTARMINNFLSHDWVRQGPAGATGRFLIQLKNATTAIELGFSPFHAVFETNEVVGSSLGLSIAKIATPGRRVEGFKELLQALPGTVPIAGAFIPKTAARNILNEGGKIIAYAKDPEGFRATYPDAFKFLKDKYPGFEGMVDDLFTGGGVVKMQDDYHIQAAKKFSQAMADRGEGMGTAMGNYRVGKYAIPAAAQAMLKPIFEIYIPRLKVGTFAREYAFELARRSDDLASGKISRGELARQTWAFIDDRFGELNWDNLYWNRTFKSASQLLFRSVTWKLGNTRAFGKAGRDLADLLFTAKSPMGAAVRALPEGLGAAKEAFGNAPGGKVTMPLAWLTGMAVVTAIQSSIISKVFTGKYPWQLAKDAEELARNLTFPRIDKDDASQRVSNATYWKDFIHLMHSPVDYVHSSMTGELGRFWDVWQNRDFYGRQVRGPDDPPLKQIKDSIEHMIPVPFSLSSFYSAKQSGASTAKSLAGFAGYPKAPYYVSHTHAEQVANQIVRDQLPQGSMTRENYDRIQRERQVVNQVRKGETTFADAENQGLIMPKRAFESSRHSNDTYLQQQLRHISSPELAMKVWNVATPDEKTQIKSEIKQKIFNSHTLSPDEKGVLLKRLENQPAPAAKSVPAFDPNQSFQLLPR